MLRTISTVLVLVATGLLVLGCGSSHSASGSPSEADLVAFAHAVNLRASDVPGLVGPRLLRGRQIRSGPFGTTMEKCDGVVARAGEVTGIVSQRFKRNNARREGTHGGDSPFPIESVHSTVYVMGSATLASRELAAADSARSRACLKGLLAKQVALSDTGREPLFSQIAISSLPSPLPGVRVYALRTTAAFAFDLFSKGRNYHENSFGFALGPTLVTLTDTGDPHPFPSATERHLLSLLYSRAKAHTP